MQVLAEKIAEILLIVYLIEKVTSFICFPKFSCEHQHFIVTNGKLHCSVSIVFMGFNFFSDTKLAQYFNQKILGL